MTVIDNCLVCNGHVRKHPDLGWVHVSRLDLQQVLTKAHAPEPASERD